MSLTFGGAWLCMTCAFAAGVRGMALAPQERERSVRPNILLGTANDDIVLNADLAPTLLAFAGISAPARMQGRDIAPLYLGSGKPAWRDEFFYEHATIRSVDFIPASAALVRRDVKYIHWPDFDYEELFDLDRDPREERNLAREPAFATMLEQRARFADRQAPAK